jgi:hypothetical protein
MVANSHPPPDPVEKILATLRRKHTKNQWRFDYNPNCERWETYRTPIDWPHGLYGWLWALGNPGSDPAGEDHCVWDYHGGHIYFYDEKLVTAFLLKWS